MWSVPPFGVYMKLMVETPTFIKRNNHTFDFLWSVAEYCYESG